MVFGGELGHNYLAVKNFVAERRIPLLGPPTSHPWLYFGPLFYWLIAPVLIIGKYDPVIVSYFFAILFSLSIFLVYFLTKGIYNRKTAVIAALLITVSPTWLFLTRNSRFFSLSTLAFFPFYYYFYLSLKTFKKSHIFLTGLFYGVMLNFHLSGILLLPTILVFLFLRRKRITLGKLVIGFSGLILANSPFLLYNFLNKFEMLGKLLIWVPYRIAGFVGLYPKNTADTKVVGSNFYSFYEFVSDMMGEDTRVTGLIVFTTLVFSIYFVFSKKPALDRLNIKLPIVMILLGFMTIFFHGDPPPHYYMPLYPVLIILMASLLVTILKMNKKVFVLLVSVLLFSSVFTLYESRWYKENKSGLNYEDMKSAAWIIINDSSGRKYYLERDGINDQFEGDFAQHYHYLLWLYGNEPIKSAPHPEDLKNGDTVYSIVELSGQDTFPNASDEIIYTSDKLIISKKVVNY